MQRTREHTGAPPGGLAQRLPSKSTGTSPRRQSAGMAERHQQRPNGATQTTRERAASGKPHSVGSRRVSALPHSQEGQNQSHVPRQLGYVESLPVSWKCKTFLCRCLRRTESSVGIHAKCSHEDVAGFGGDPDQPVSLAFRATGYFAVGGSCPRQRC